VTSPDPGGRPGALYAFDSLEIVGGSTVNYIRSYLGPAVTAASVSLALFGSGFLGWAPWPFAAVGWP
jgi:hypothetical protein